MSLRLFTLFGARRRTTPSTRRTRPQSFFRPALEGLEQREVMSSPATLAPPALGPALAPAAPAVPIGQQLFNALHIHINNVLIQNGQLVANGTWLSGVPFHQTLSLTASPNAADPTCPILHLSLGPVNLSLLGLNVNLDDCSGGPVVVDITANPAGGLLGRLLCDVANLLNGGSPLSTVLGGLTGGQRSLLSHGLTNLLNGLLGGNGIGGAAGGATLLGPMQAGSNDCPILNLTIPDGLHLSLLGLNVDTSPICLSVTATPGPGNLLGNLLCDVSHLLDNPGGLVRILRNIEHTLNSILSHLP